MGQAQDGEEGEAEAGWLRLGLALAAACGQRSNRTSVVRAGEGSGDAGCSRREVQDGSRQWI